MSENAASLGSTERAVLDAAEHWHHVTNDMAWDADGFIEALADANAALDEAVKTWLRATPDNPPSTSGGER